MNEENLLTNISENEYSELLNTEINQIQTGRNTLAIQVSTTFNLFIGILENYCMIKK